MLLLLLSKKSKTISNLPELHPYLSFDGKDPFLEYHFVVEVELTVKRVPRGFYLTMCQLIYLDSDLKIENKL